MLKKVIRTILLRAWYEMDLVMHGLREEDGWWYVKYSIRNNGSQLVSNVTWLYSVWWVFSFDATPTNMWDEMMGQGGGEEKCEREGKRSGLVSLLLVMERVIGFQSCVGYVTVAVAYTGSSCIDEAVSSRVIPHIVRPPLFSMGAFAFTEKFAVPALFVLSLYSQFPGYKRTTGYKHTPRLHRWTWRW